MGQKAKNAGKKKSNQTHKKKSVRNLQQNLIKKLY